MATICHPGFLNFKVLVADQFGSATVHHHTKFIKIDQMVAEILRLMVFKMVAV